MIIKNIPKKMQISSNDITINLLESGDVFNITSNKNQINLLRGNILDGSISNIYLKVFDEDQTVTTPLIGVRSNSTFNIANNKAIYTGEFYGIKYQVEMNVVESTWFYNISYDSKIEKEIQFYYGQDVGINPSSTILSSEPYTVHYIDYKVFENQDGYTLCARQNQGPTQFLQIGSSAKTIGYVTDGFQFFGKEYKYTNIPKAYNEDLLESKIYQYEFSYLTLQTEKLNATDSSCSINFYGHYDSKFIGIIKEPKVINQPEYKFETNMQTQHQKSTIISQKTINGISVDEKFLLNKYDIANHKEYDKGTLLSFFSKNHHHIVTLQKELLVERPHGNLMIHGDITNASENVMATTNFMFGVFNSHIVIGNTTFNKLIGDVRNPLNLLKVGGQRIYIKINNEFRILGVPSYYDMGVTQTKWVYVLENDIITITSYVDINKTTQRLQFSSSKKYDIIVSNQILMGSEENMHDIQMDFSEDTYSFSAPKNSMMGNEYPNLVYKIKTTPSSTVLSEEEVLGYNAQMGMLFMSFESINEVNLDIFGSLNNEIPTAITIDSKTADIDGTNFFKSFLQNFEIESDDKDIQKIIDISFWYTHNALVHYSSPHGLEQYNGAAWGTRDVCQGPAELFMAAQRYDLVRTIILKIYKRQFLENGDFPQWFMYDKYYKIQAHESHGDVIIWPIRLLANYLNSTNDFTILHEKVPYMSMKQDRFTKEVKLIDHVKHQLETIENSFIKNTFLPKYGGGDWDDTLQPANQNLKENMVSGWTVALLYEAINVLSIKVKHYDEDLYCKLTDLQINIKKDYNKFIINDELPAGFVVFNGNHKLLIHPNDNKTGLKYRLLPYLRSMISSLASTHQVEKYLEVINSKFKHPDGVRLMDTTVTYKGGEQTYFQRAETAANFGREIGLQYVHAHIRYIEAMYHVGATDNAYRGLYEINPILIQETVENAVLRQSNMYFSSSDAEVSTRYEAQENFEKIRSGQINVKGGWRLYSSGPGIYIKQVISNLLGIDQLDSKLLIDPSSYSYAKLNKIKYHYKGHKLIINIHKGSPALVIKNQPASITKIYNKYRFKGYLVDFEKVILDKDIVLDLHI